MGFYYEFITFDFDFQTLNFDFPLPMTIFTKNSSSKMLRTLIIDDESHIRKTLQGLLISFCPLVKVVSLDGTVKDGEKEIRQKRPGLLLLDIKMGDGTGFDLLNRFENIDFRIIFVTAWGKYAIKAFGFSAIDYLLKPLTLSLIHI